MPIHSNATAPTSEPTVVRRFQCTFVSTTKSTNNNKEWGFRFWEKEGIIQYFWGRSGEPADPRRTKVVYGDLHDADKKASKKTNPKNKPEDYYEEVKLQQKSNPPAAVLQMLNAPQQPSTLHPEVYAAVKYVFNVANAHIKTHLNGTIDSLSVDQLNVGRSILGEARNLLPVFNRGSRDTILLDTVNRYYRAIPTIVPRRITADDLVQTFYGDLHEYEDRIDQLEAALSTYQYTVNTTQPQIDPVETHYQSLGIELTPLSTGDNNYDMAERFITSTMMREKARIAKIYAVHIPAERAGFNQWVNQYVGNGDPSRANHKMFCHGTARPNVQHILRTGLKIPQNAANGSRFGRGIYFAPNSARSLMYTDYRHEGDYPKPDEYWMMFLNQVALGKSKEYRTEDYSLTSAPSGYDSVFSNISHGGRGGEYIVYRLPQQTIRLMIMFQAR